jgi:prephenate dehydratase
VQPTENHSKTILIGYQGAEGSNNHEVALAMAKKHFATAECRLVPLNNSYNVVQKVINKEVDYGIVAKHNVIGGEVKETADSLYGLKFDSFDKHRKLIKHCLCAAKGVDIKDITEVISHEQALRQCDKNLKRILPQAKISPVEDTAYAAKSVANEKNPNRIRAAVCTALAASLHNLDVIDANISDIDINYTDFIMLNNVRESNKDLFLRVVQQHNSTHFIQFVIGLGVTIAYLSIKLF